MKSSLPCQTHRPALGGRCRLARDRVAWQAPRHGVRQAGEPARCQARARAGGINRQHHGRSDAILNRAERAASAHVLALGQLADVQDAGDRHVKCAEFFDYLLARVARVKVSVITCTSF